MQRIKSPCFSTFHLFFRSLRKNFLGQILLFVLLKFVRCCEYTESGPAIWSGGKGIYKVTILSEAFPCPMNF